MNRDVRQGENMGKRDEKERKLEKRENKTEDKKINGKVMHKKKADII